MSRTCPVQDVQDIENSVGHCPTPALTPDDAEVLKQILTRSFTNNMILQRHYLWRIYASGDIGGKDDNRDWGMDDAK